MTVTAMKTESVHEIMQGIGEAARSAYRRLSVSTEEERNNALQNAATALREATKAICEANAKDMAAAEAKGLSGAMLDRLRLDDARVEAMAAGLEAVAALPDPLGKRLAEWDRPNGLNIARVSVPLGVIGIIYESRPNVTADAAGLCLKSGNAAILRGGSESFHSSQAILEAMQQGIREAGLPEAAVQSIPTTDREAVGEMLTMVGLIDVIVPRGGKSLTARIQEESKIPTLQHLDGNCHIYVHKAADPDKAVEVIRNAKMRRTGICGAAESLLIDRDIAESVLPSIVDRLSAENCQIKGDEKSCAIDHRISPASNDDWGTEYLDAIISVKLVDGEREAIDHVNRYSSHHTDCIITEDETAASAFLAEVDSAIVMHNASTQFADGGEFGMGAEIGISTGRLHARGPVGAAELTTYKYIVRGDGQTRP